MKYRLLGRTGLQVSAVSFGAGPVSGWATDSDSTRQQDVVRRALEVGINWFDTAPTYSDGRSERALGQTLSELKPHHQVHLATKVRITDEAFLDLRGFIRKSVEQSLERLNRPQVTLLQLHNSVTAKRGDQPTSVNVEDVLGTNGVLAAFEELRDARLVSFLGLTGLGDASSLKSVIASGRFDTVQAPYHLLNPSAGHDVTPEFSDLNLGNLFRDCQQQNMGVFAIRVFAGGALAQREPSAHTRITRFFPLDLYQRDRADAALLERSLPNGLSLPEAAVRFVLKHRAVSSALIGFGSQDEVDAAVRFAERFEHDPPSESD